MKPRTVLVTGAGSGIGAAVVLAAARTGARVAAIDNDGERVAKVAAEARSIGVAALALEIDVRDHEAVAEAVEQCRHELGVATAVLANAGVELNGAAHELPSSQWQTTLDVNLSGVFATVRAAIGAMLDEGVGGSVVCTSSPAAFVGFAGGGNAAYAASKGGVSALVRSLAIDYARAQIRVNAIVPGATDTPMLTTGEPVDERTAARARILDEAREQIPLGRLGKPEEIAAGVLWLWSESAAYVTGAHLTIDGGLMAKSANTF